MGIGSEVDSQGGAAATNAADGAAARPLLRALPAFLSAPRAFARQVGPDAEPPASPEPTHAGAPLVATLTTPSDTAAPPAGAPATVPAEPPPPLNPLLSTAAPLLDLAASLRDRAGHADPEGLRVRTLAELRRFDSTAAAAGLSPEEIRVGRFALAATLDDVVRATPWGARSSWLRDGLCNAVDRDAGGPERFFDLLDTMLGDPRLHVRELELFYACLSLGFEGRYRGRPRGAHELAHLRDELYRILRRQRGDRDRTLSPSWRGRAEPFRPLGLAVPAWAAWAVVAVGLALLFGQLHGSLARQAEPVAARLAALLPERPIEIARLAPPPPPAAGPALIARVTSLLVPEIRANAVEVLAGEDGALVIRIPAAAMFATGSEVVKARHRAIVDRVGQALGPEAGHVVVVGHTDDQTPRTGRFPTAQTLTEARAEAVRKLLERYLGPSRLSAEGHGDAEPIALNATAAGREANRRIDVRLYPQ